MTAIERNPTCVFCQIIAGEKDRANMFWEDDTAIGLLDHRPLKPGHALLIPKQHFVTIKEMPSARIKPFFERAALLNRAVEIAFEADGSFSCYNTTISQSVDHFHLHVVPRTFGDKLFSGGKWKRIPITNQDHQRERCQRLGDVMRSLTDDGHPR